MPVKDIKVGLFFLQREPLLFSSGNCEKVDFLILMTIMSLTLSTYYIYLEIWGLKWRFENNCYYELVMIY